MVLTNGGAFRGNYERKTPPDESKTVYAELNKGDAFFMFASCFHGGSANSTADSYRLVYSTFVTRGWLRQEDNVSSCPPAPLFLNPRAFFLTWRVFLRCTLPFPATSS